MVDCAPWPRGLHGSEVERFCTSPPKSSGIAESRPAPASLSRRPPRRSRTGRRGTLFGKCAFLERRSCSPRRHDEIMNLGNILAVLKRNLLRCLSIGKLNPFRASISTIRTTDSTRKLLHRIHMCRGSDLIPNVWRSGQRDCSLRVAVRILKRLQGHRCGFFREHPLFKTITSAHSERFACPQHETGRSMFTPCEGQRD